MGRISEATRFLVCVLIREGVLQLKGGRTARTGPACICCGKMFWEMKRDTSEEFKVTQRQTDVIMLIRATQESKFLQEFCSSSGMQKTKQKQKQKT